MTWTREQKIEYAREYYKKNKEAILKKKREKEADPQVKQKLKEYLSSPKVAEHRRNYTRRKRQDVEYRQAELDQGRSKRQKRRDLLNAIQMHYKCSNPACPWKGEYIPEILDFHHFDPATKSGQISLMISHKNKKLAAEVNKCVILCRNCHALFHHGDIQLNEGMICCVNDDLEIIKD